MSAIGRRFSRHASRRLQRGFINIGVRKLLLFGAKPFSIADLFKNGEPGAHFEAYDPSTLLARRNRFTSSEDFTNTTAWPRTNLLSVTSRLDGVGDLVVPSTTNGVHKVAQFSGASIGVSNCISVRAKAGGYDWIVLEIGTGSVFFNVNAGTKGAVSAGFTGTITPATGGYYDCSVSGVPAGASATIYVTNANSVTAFAADGVSGVYLARAQVESNTAVPSAYQLVTDWNTEYLAAAPSANVGMWQDSAATTATYAVEQPVGKWMDWKGVKGAAGNHASQATAGQRPVLSARVNLFTKSEQFDDAAHTKTDVTVTANATADPNGNTTADLLTEGSAGTANTTQAATTIASAPLTLTLSLKRGNTDWVLVTVGTTNAFRAWVNVNTGAIGTTGTIGAGAVLTSASPAAQANGFTRVTLKGTCPGTSVGYNVQSASADASTTRVNAATYYAWGVDLRYTDDATRNAPAYQRINTTSDFDTTGFPDYERLDGIDDNLAAASGGGGTTGFLYCAAITPTGGAGAARVLWADTGTNTGYRVQINTSNQLQIDAGNATAFTSIATVATLPLTETHVLTAWDDGVNLNVQIDNGAVASVARPAVSAGSAGFSIGKSNTAASGFFTGRIYTTTYRQSDCGDAKRAKLKRYHAQLVGMTL